MLVVTIFCRPVPSMGFSVFGQIPNSSLQYLGEYKYA